MRGCVGVTDKIIRVLIGLAALGVAVAQRGQIGAGWLVVLYVVAALGVITGLAGWCPLYALLGLRTCPTQHKA